MGRKRNEEVKYNHFYFEADNVVLIGVNKDIGEEEASIFVDSPLQEYDFAGEIVELKDLRDRKVLFDTVDKYISEQKKEKKQKRGKEQGAEFHGVYWDILLDFILFEEGKIPYDMAAELSHVIPNYKAKNIRDTLVQLRKNKGNAHDETLKWVELICYYMGVTKGIVETGKGTWYIFEDKENRTAKSIYEHCKKSYTMESIYEYCEEKRWQGQKIDLRKMIKEITGLKYREIRAVPIRIWVKEYMIDEKTKQFMKNLIKQMKKRP